MKYVLLITCCGILSVGLLAQVNADIHLVPIEGQGELDCYAVEIRQKEDPGVMLAGQNYRFFYSSATLSFDEESLKLNLPEDQYYLNLVQHKSNVDGSHIGVLPFDHDLGFVNISVVLNGTNTRGIRLNKEQWTSIAQMCFQKLGQEGAQDIVIARPELTKSYGRAYVEVTYVNEEGSVSSMSLREKIDIHKLH